MARCGGAVPTATSRCSWCTVPSYDDWSLPKGKCDKGEADDDCAHREVLEETGLDCALGPELPSTRYADRFGRDKVVRYWAMTPGPGRFVPSDEVDRVEWLAGTRGRRPTQLRPRPGHRRGAGRRSRRRRPLMAVLVVRHAKAGDRSSWPGADRDRPLSGKGRRQAEALVDTLSDWKPVRILSSPFARCVQTVEPLA